MENIEEKKKSKDRIDSMVFKMIMTFIILAIPFTIYKSIGFQDAIITSITEIIFLLVATREDILELIKKLDK